MPFSYRVSLSTSFSSSIEAIILFKFGYYLQLIIYVSFIHIIFILCYILQAAFSDSVQVACIFLFSKYERIGIDDNHQFVHFLLFAQQEQYNIQHMKKMPQQFVEIPDQIPYKRITDFRIISVQYENNEFKIKLDRKCENLPEEKQYTIIRKNCDFQWLLSNIQKQNPEVFVLPSLMETSWAFVQALANRLSDKSKNDLRRWSNEKFLTKSAERFLIFLNQVSKRGIYRMPGFSKSSLFTFLDTSYDLYKLQTYQDKGLNRQPTVSGGSAFSNLAQSIGKGGLKILGMLNVVSQQSNQKYLQNEIQKLTNLQQQIKNFNTGLQGIQKSLDLLIENFLNEKGLKQKSLLLYEIYLKSSNCLRLNHQVLNQMKQIARKCSILQSKNQDKQNIKQQIKSYEVFINKEIQEIKKQFQQVLAQYYKKCFQDTVQIKLTSIYPSKI